MFYAFQRGPDYAFIRVVGRTMPSSVWDGGRLRIKCRSECPTIRRPAGFCMSSELGKLAFSASQVHRLKLEGRQQEEKRFTHLSVETEEADMI